MQNKCTKTGRISLFENPKVINRVIQALDDAGIPASVDYIANVLGMNWASTRAILFQLSLEGKLKAVKTTKSWIFYRGTIKDQPSSKA